MKQWFEDNTQYTRTAALPSDFPEDTSLIRVYPNGATQPGWGAKEYMQNMQRGAFNMDRALRFYEKYRQPFGIVMRSIPMLCVDIDGKNGGIETSRVLDLPPTLAERSKSGNGYHLFYYVPGPWNHERGFDAFPDLIGLIPGVDIKGTGIVYHYPTQTWNSRLDLAKAPKSFLELVDTAGRSRRQARLTRHGVSGLDEDEKVLMHDQLRTKLEGSFPEGSRNNKLFSLGCQMFVSDYPGWDTALYDRGVEIGLTLKELTQMIENIAKYSE